MSNHIKDHKFPIKVKPSEKKPEKSKADDKRETAREEHTNHFTNRAPAKSK